MRRRARARRSRSSCRWYWSGVLLLVTVAAMAWGETARFGDGPPRRAPLDGRERGGAHGGADGRAQAHRYAIDAKWRERPRTPRGRGERATGGRKKKHHKKNTGRPLNKSALPAEPRPRRARHLADARAFITNLQRAARARGRLGFQSYARLGHRRREPTRRGGATREGRLSARRDAGAVARSPPEHERVYI